MSLAPSIPEVIEANDLAVELAVRDEGVLDQFAAHSVMSNAYMLASSLELERTLKLSSQALRSLSEASEAATVLVEDEVNYVHRNKREGDDSFVYRAHIVRPLNILAARLERREFSNPPAETLRDLKRAVWTAGVAFSEILSDDSTGEPQKLALFMDKAQAAVQVPD